MCKGIKILSIFTKKLSKFTKNALTGSQNLLFLIFFKEKPFTNPDFDQQALAEFMEVDVETFRQLVPRYKDPDRTLDYINSLRAEYAAKILMDHSDYLMDDMASLCGFKDTAALISTFKFAFGVTPTEYLHSMTLLFKKKQVSSSSC